MEAVNWNTIPDPIDKQIWDRLTANFWLDTKIPVSNDLASWGTMTEEEKEVVRKVFASLTMLDTLQSTVGAPTLLRLALTPHEEAVYTNIAFMESVHAKSYSSIFSTLCSTEEINGLFRWAKEDPWLQHQVKIIHEAYSNSALGREEGYWAHAASVMLESFLFYTGFYAPLRFAAEGKLTNTADIIRLIMRDEGVHGYYIGYKFQQHRLPETMEKEVTAMLMRLYTVEAERAEQIYDPVGWTEDVKKFLRYNANKAMANMGFGPIFAEADTDIPAYILAALDTGTGETHDFFSGSGASYIVGTAEETLDEDWGWD